VSKRRFYPPPDYVGEQQRMLELGLSAGRRIVVEVDGGSRTLHGLAGVGVVARSERTGAVLVEKARCIGTATAAEAEYRALIFGLEIAFKLGAVHAIAFKLGAVHAEVRTDSQDVVEQMSGRAKARGSLVPLRSKALTMMQRIEGGVLITWIPREQNSHADRLVTEALDTVMTRRGGRTRLDGQMRAVLRHPRRGWADK
jgi:ribonuclease HI